MSKGCYKLQKVDPNHTPEFGIIKTQQKHGITKRILETVDPSFGLKFLCKLIPLFIPFLTFVYELMLLLGFRIMIL